MDPRAMWYAARDGLLGAAGAIGLTEVVADTDWRRRRLLILCYHGLSLSDEHVWNPEFYMPREVFRGRMRRLRERGYTVLPLAEAVERLRAGELPPRSVSVTFDDGLYDFLAVGLPVLQEFEIPVTNYVPTFYAEFGRPVFDPAFDYLVWKGRARGRLDVRDLLPQSAPLSIATPAERRAASQTVRRHIHDLQLSAADKDRLLGAVAASLGIDYDHFVESRTLQQMNASELRSLPSGLVDIQLHTHRHRMPLDRESFENEVLTNRACLARLLGSADPRQHFCYPSGVYQSEHVRWLAELGVISATTSAAHIAGPADSQLVLPRFSDSMRLPTALFDAWVSGLYPALRRRRRDSDADRGRGHGAPSTRPPVTSVR